MVGSQPKHPGDARTHHFLAVTVAAIFDQSPHAVNTANDENSEKVGIHDCTQSTAGGSKSSLPYLTIT